MFRLRILAGTRVATLTPAFFVASVSRAHGGHSRVVELDYDSGGLLVAARLPEGVTFDYQWNEAHLPELIVSSAGDRLEYLYDERGNREAERLVESAGQVRRSTSFSWNAAGLLESISAGTNPASWLAYDGRGNLLSVTDPQSRSTTFD